MSVCLDNVNRCLNIPRHFCISSQCLDVSTQWLIMYMCLDMSRQYQTMSRHISGLSMLLSMAPLHLLGHNDQNEVKHDSLYI